MSTISAGTTSTTTLIHSGDTTGSLVLKTNDTGSGGTTAVTIDTSQRVAFVAGTAAAPAITTAGDTNTGVFYPAADTVGVSTGGSERMRIDTSGNVGIGTSSPSSPLNVVSSAASGLAIAINGRSSDNLGSMFFYANNGSTQYSTITASASEFRLSSIPAAAVQTFYTNGSERMRIDSSGNVGIGTSSPSAKFEVYDASTAVARVTAGTEIFEIRNTGSEVRLAVVSADPMTFRTSNVEAMRIDSSGYVYMNTTSNWSGNAILNVVGANWVVSGYSTGTASNTGAFLSRVDNTSCRLMMFYYGATTNVGYITTNGTTTSYGSASDYRLKENIAPMTGALAKVALLKPVTYTWKSDGSDGQGFIAHELQEVVPNCVAGEKDAVDAEGNPQYQAVDTSFLVATLTAALQEQQALIQALTDRITALEGK